MSFYNELIESFMEDKSIKLPKRLKKFFTTEFEKYDGKFVSNLPNYSSDSRMQISFEEEALADLFDEHMGNDLANEEERFQFLPFASIGDAQYLVAKLSEECPIYMWEHEDGEFHEHSASLDEFLEGLHDEDNEDDSEEEDREEDEEQNEKAKTPKGDWKKRIFKTKEGVVFGTGKSAGVGKPGEVPLNYNPNSENPASAYRNIAGCPKDEKWDYVIFIDRWNWEKYDYTKWPSADLTFPDLDEDKVYDLWPFKPKSGMESHSMHWFDLHQFKSGIVRKVMIEEKEKDFELPKQYIGKDAQKFLVELESLVKEGSEAKIKAAGFKSVDHVKFSIAVNKSAVKKAYAEAYAEADKALNETTGKMAKQMDANVTAAKKGGLLDPVKGISMEDWAGANAKLSSGMPLKDILKVLSIEKPAWDEVSAEWNARMSRDTTFAISTVYGNAFVDSNIGKFASTGSNGGGKASGAVEKVKNDFDLYVKIMCHQNMGAVQGLDANAVLEQYELNAADWATLGAHWTPKMMSTEIAMKMGTLMEKYNAEFAAGSGAKVGDDISY